MIRVVLEACLFESGVLCCVIQANKTLQAIELFLLLAECPLRSLPLFEQLR